MAVIVQPLNFIYKIGIGDVTIHCKQLSYRVRSQIGARFISQKEGTSLEDTVSLLYQVLRHCVVKVEGFKNPDGTDYELKFENGVLTEESLEPLMYVETVGDVLNMCASNFINFKMPDKILNPVDGEPLEGVSIEKVKDVKKK